MNEIQIKSLSIASILAVAFLLSAFLQQYFIYFFAALIVIILAALVYLFSIQMSREDLISKSKFLIIPLLFNSSAMLFLSVYANTYIRLLFVLLIAAANYYLFVALKKVQNLEERTAIFQRNILISISFFTLLLSLSAVFRSYVIYSTSKAFSMPVSAVLVLVALIYYFLLYFLSWENGLDMKKILPYNLVATLMAAEITLFGVVWIVNYPVFSNAERANLSGFPLPAVFLTIVFYFIWGLISHKSDRSLTRRVMTEYIIISVLFLSILLVTAKWLPVI